VGAWRNGESEMSSKFDDVQALSVRNSTLVYFVDARDCWLSKSSQVVLPHLGSKKWILELQEAFQFSSEAINNSFSPILNVLVGSEALQA
jgi:hypothetical protein